MNWLEKIEEKRQLLVFGTVLICVATLALTSRRHIVSLDSFWHLQTGLDWLRSGLTFWKDHYSFTYRGQEISGPPYMFQTFLGWLVDQLGLKTGFEVYRLVGFISAFGLTAYFLKKLRSSVLVYCLVLPTLVMLLQLRSIVRPELLSFSFSIVAVMLYYRARNSMSVATMLPIVLFMWVLNNYHSPIFGYIIFFGLFVDFGLKQLREHAKPMIWFEWVFWGVVIVGVGFLTPNFNHPLILLLTFDPEWKVVIHEYYPSSEIYAKVLPVYGPLLIGIVTLIQLIRARHVGLLIVSCLLIYFSIAISRLVAPSGIVILCIFAWAMSDIDLPKFLNRVPRVWSIAIGITTFAVFSLTLWAVVATAREFIQLNRTAPTVFPNDVVDYMIDEGISGRIFNDYGTGGYLIHRLAPDSQVYIDGRTAILYPIDHFRRHKEAALFPASLNNEIEKYGIELVILENSKTTYSLLEESGIFGLDFVGAKFSLFRNENPKLPTFGTLLASPACWREGIVKDLEQEESTAIWITPGNSLLFPFMEFVMQFSAAENKRLFLSDMDPTESWTEYSLRFAAFQALNLGSNQLAHEMFAGISNKEFSDYLAGALAKVRLAEFQEAEQMLDSVTRLPWAKISVSEYIILHWLLTYIRSNHQLVLIGDSYVEQIASQGANSAGHRLDLLTDITAFCSEQAPRFNATVTN